ncbi:MAG TPA: GH1 family beta-glucosidase [Acidimicrobiia bacterium]|nr:GH1 family beta-glucosidase [Acidimicrobiia bacterium]
MTAASEFPPNFLWGVATASYQIEGAVAEDGRRPSIWDTFSHTPGRTRNGDNGDLAVDHYHRYADDVALMADLGISAYRFSIAWSRILPEGTGRVNEAGIDFYRRLCKELVGAGITPVVTLYHWDLPQALQDRGGWLNRESVDWFAEYTAVTKEGLGDLIRIWATLNEPWCTAFLGYSSGEHAPGITDPAQSFVAAHHLMLAHHAGIRVLRNTNSHDDDQLGIVLNLIPAWPASDSAEDAFAAASVDAVNNRLFTEAVFHGRYPAEILGYVDRYGVASQIDTAELARALEPVDFLGINYYNVNRVQHAPGAPAMANWPGSWEAKMITPPGRRTEMGWGVEPEGLTWILERVGREHPGVPLCICENGAAYPDLVSPDGTVNDPDRIAYLADHIQAMHKALERGVDIRGYFVWSLIDNFEWARGFEKRFGIVWVDLETMERTVKASGHWYRDFIGGRVAARM